MNKARGIGVWMIAGVFAVGPLADAGRAQSSPAPQEGQAPTSSPPAPRVSFPPAAAGVTAPQPAPTTAVVPVDYVIGPDDILSIVFWRDEAMTTDVVVRPDGKISLPVLNELQASGLTPEQLRERVIASALKYFAEPSVHVVVKQINSRKVFVTGEVAKPGTYALSSPMTVIQLLALAGGLNEYAKKNDIAVIRTENGRPRRYPVKYGDIIKGNNLQQNIELKVGDVVIVP
jgi:polysaccharide export outer membrane protein